MTERMDEFENHGQNRAFGPSLTAAGAASAKGWRSRPWAWALAAKELIESRLRHPDGHKVECVIADGTIGGGEEAAACAEKFKNNNVAVTLSVTPCWCYGSETWISIP